MPTSDKELQSLQDDVAKLREQVESEERKRVDGYREVENDAAAVQLKAEKDRLKDQLAALKAGNTKSAINQGAAMAVDPEGTAARQQRSAGASKSSDKE